MRLGLKRALIIGIAIRIVLSAYTQHSAVYAKAESLDQLFLIGSDPLARATSFGPSFYLFYAPFYLFYWLISQYLGIHYDFVLALFLKIPPLIGDIITTYALYEIGFFITKKPDKARSLAILYFLNPYVIWITAIVGHAESLWVAFVLLSISYLVREKVGKAAIALGVATMFRELPLLLLPFFAYYVYKHNAFSKFIKPYLFSTAILAVPFAVSFLEIYASSPPLAVAFLQHFVGTGSAVQGTGSYGIESIIGFTYNFTGLIASFGMWPTLAQFFGFSHFLILFVVLTTITIKKGSGNIIWLNRTILMAYSILLLFTPLIQNEYLSWILPFVMIETTNLRGLPRIIPHVLTWTALLIDPITQGGFYYYTYDTFPFPNPPHLTGAWPLNVPLIYESVTAPHALTILFVAIFSILAIFKERGAHA